jgi:hypothetical protein
LNGNSPRIGSKRGLFAGVGPFCGPPELLIDGFALGRQMLNVLADELLQVRFALDVEFPADPGEPVGSFFNTYQCEFPHVLLVDQAHAATGSALNLS